MKGRLIPLRRENQKQYQIPGDVKISTSLKDVDDAAVMILSFSPIKLTCWAYAEAEGSERIIMNWYKLNQIVKPVATAVLYVLSLLQQISAILGTWYTSTDTANAFLFQFAPKAALFSMTRSTVHLHSLYGM